MHFEQNGKLLKLPVVNHQPILEKAQVVRLKARKAIAASKRTSRNYFLKSPQIKLLETFDQTDNGTLDLEFKDGMPCCWNSKSA